jgi:hypothetical protein
MTKNTKYLKYPCIKIVAFNPLTLQTVELPSVSSSGFYGFTPKGVTEVLCGCRKTHRSWVFRRIEP